MKHQPLLQVCLMLVFISSGVFAQDTSLYIPKNFRKAYDNHTRTMTGEPGKNYWQNHADYTIEVSLEPETRKISGHETITYTNSSPDYLGFLVIKLFPNLYLEGNSRDDLIDPSDEFTGVEISKLKIDNQNLDVSPSGPDIRYIHNDFIIYLPKPIPPGGKSELSVSWDYILNAHSHLREGMVDPGTFFVAYFFPHIAVYDDIDGWDDSKYTGTPEFYNDFGNFDVTIRVPQNYLVWATGELQNPGEVLSEMVYERYKAAHLSDDIVHIIGASDLSSGNLTKRNSINKWKFNAENVSDFAFGTSDHYLWDGSGLQVDRETGRRVFIDAAYNRNSTDFYQVAQIARDAIEYMSFQFPAVAFPYPKMTVFNGLSEMEYPMMVNDISTGSISETIKLTSHEIFHSYFPFYTGMNETKYAWMDEGLTSYGESIIASALDSLPFSGFYFSSAFRAYAGDDNDVPIFVSSEYLKSPVYYGNSYPKAATFFKILNDYLGEEKFSHALHAFINHWKGKHPIPHDLLFTFIDDTGEDLAWLIKPWIFEFGFVDLALASFDKSEDGYMATILKKGPYPTPFSLRIEYKNGEIQNIRKDVSVWKPDRKSHTFEIKTDEEIVSVRIINEQYFDIDLSNNSWK